MFDIGWSELLVIGVVALIVVGPKDLPGMFRALGRVTAKARAMAREFSRAMEDAARESGVDEVAGDLKAITSKKSLGLEALERATDKFEKWDPKFPKPGLDTPPELPSGEDMALADAAEEAFEPEEIPASAPAPAEPPKAQPIPQPEAGKAGDGAGTGSAPSAEAPDASKKDEA